MECGSKGEPKVERSREMMRSICGENRMDRDKNEEKRGKKDVMRESVSSA